MREQELLKMIKESAQDVEAPEQLAPEVMERKLERQKGLKRNSRKWWRPGSSWKQLTAVAAVLVVAAGITAVAGSGLWSGDKNDSGQVAGAIDGAVKASHDTTEDAGATRTDDFEEMKREPKQDAGDMFQVAQDYDQVYAKLEEYLEISRTYSEDGIKMEAAAEDEASSAPEVIQKDSQSVFMGAANMSGYSKTNVQTTGVDESDIVKTDGTYIYAVHQDGVEITDISGDTMTQAARIRLEDPAARVMEMYVQGNMLNLIVQQADSDLKQSAEGNRRETEDVFYMDTTSSTHLLTYDISDRSAPVLAGEVSQDGSYYTSRKIGSIVYLFTTEYEMTDIPSIGGLRVAYDCIYLPERGRQGLLVSSVDVEKPTQVLDHVMVVNDYVEIYVSTGAMYLYQYSWRDQNPVTQIAKFTLDQGTIDAVGSTSVSGQILDTFAIHEGGGQLRVLTTDWDDQEENNLFILDDQLKLVGSLQGLAAGEQIYAARFLGNMAYFVTYRNTDPLFAVDLSDPAEPKVLSELKITGFSEYLHFWGPDRLLGIGYETDPDTGRQLGLKLTMFDISDPAAVGVLDSTLLQGLDHSPAMYEYKTVLADGNANLLGFVGVDYQDSGEECNYYLYQWGESGFERLLKEEVDFDAGMSEYRGLYSGAKFYLAKPDGIISYDREKEYEKIESLEY